MLELAMIFFPLRSSRPLCHVKFRFHVAFQALTFCLILKLLGFFLVFWDRHDVFSMTVNPGVQWWEKKIIFKHRVNFFIFWFWMWWKFLSRFRTPRAGKNIDSSKIWLWDFLPAPKCFPMCFLCPRLYVLFCATTKSNTTFKQNCLFLNELIPFLRFPDILLDRHTPHFLPLFSDKITTNPFGHHHFLLDC